jgi:hypothetical protein
MSRPVGVLPSWATDLLYAAGAFAWSATASKVEPGAGRRASGFAPTEKPPAQHLNQVLHETCAWVAHLDTIQVQNWTPTEISGPNLKAVAWDEDANSGNGQWVAVGPAKAVYKSLDGFAWSTISGVPAGVGGAFTTVACSTGEAISGGCAIMGDATHFRVYIYKNAVWTAVDVSGTAPRVKVCYWARDLELFLVGGSAEVAGSQISAMWTTPDAATFTSQTISNTANSTLDSIQGIAGGELSTGALIYVAFSQNDTTPANAGTTWTSADGVTWTERPTAAIFQPVAIAFSDEEKCFLITTAAGAVYRSVDGINWSVLGGTGLAFAARCLAAKGSLWVALGDDEIRYALGSGGDWRKFNRPSGWTPQFLTYGDSRFMGVSIDAIGPATHIVASLRLGSDEKTS